MVLTRSCNSVEDASAEVVASFSLKVVAAASVSWSEAWVGVILVPRSAEVALCAALCVVVVTVFRGSATSGAIRVAESADVVAAISLKVVVAAASVVRSGEQTSFVTVVESARIVVRVHAASGMESAEVGPCRPAWVA